MLYRKWHTPEIQQHQVESLAQTLKVSPLMAKVLVSKGADSAEKAKDLFLTEQELSSPFLLKDMDIAVDRINQAIENEEKIVVYGDYDVDGVCATATLISCLEAMGANVFYKLPNREKEGYGLNKAVLKALKDKGVNLVITVDNGIAAIEEVRYAKEIGLEVIITDHHLPKGEIPCALAVIDPLRPDDTSPCKTLSGVGVAFKLACALEGAECEEMLDFYGDFVAVGTVADLMLLEGENRTIVKAGVRLLNENSRQGFSSLMQVAGLEGKEVTSESIAYAIGPRINAAGRMGDATMALELLLSEDEQESFLLAQELELENQKRQDTQNKMAEDITQEILSDPNLIKDRVIVVWSDDFHPGVVGIVASRLVERYAKPAIVLTKDGEEYKGSGRSVATFNLHSALDQTKQFLTRFGGHELAAGLTLQEENLEAFRKAINQVANENQELSKTESLEIDCMVSVAEINTGSVGEISFLAPFGNGNPTPLFMISNVELVGIFPVSEGKHVRLKLKQGSAFLQGIMFNVSPSEFAYVVGDCLDVCANLSIYENENGSMVSVRIKEVRPSAMPDHIIEDYDIYKLFKNNLVLDAEKKSFLCPDRAQAVEIYKYILSHSVPCDDLRPLFMKFPHICSGKIQVILDVLLDLGLIENALKNQHHCFVPVKVTEKRDLFSSSIIKALQS